MHLDAAIRIMCPDAEPELIRPKKPGCDWFGRGELARAVLDVLRALTSARARSLSAAGVEFLEGGGVRLRRARREFRTGQARL